MGNVLILVFSAIGVYAGMHLGLTLIQSIILFIISVAIVVPVISAVRHMNH